MATERDYYKTGDSGVANTPEDFYGTGTALAQSFIASSDYSITLIKLKLRRTGSPGTLTVTVYNADGSGFPTGDALCSGTRNGNNVTTGSNGFWYNTFIDTPVDLSSGERYVIVLTAPEGDYSNYISWRIDFGGAGGYDNGIFSFYIDGSWQDVAPGGFTKDSMFATWGEELSPYKVTNPRPEDDETGVNRVTNLTWEAGEETADDYDVRFGTPGNMVLVGTEVANELFDIADYTGGLDLDTEYEWRIDSYVGGELVATGDVWSYTTRAQRTVVLSTPTNGTTDKLLPPFSIVWTIDGIGAQYGSEEDQDFLFIYMRKDDANFTEDNLIGNFVQAFYNDDLRIVALTAPVYGSTYYWQVQAGNTAADLADSEVWSFTMLELLPPVASGGDTPTGKNYITVIRRLVAATKNKIFYEDL